MTSSSRRAITRLLLITTALAPMGAAHAQSQLIALGEIVVEADGETGEGYAAVSTTAGSKLALAVSEVPQSVSVVTREQLDQYPGAKADETLRYSAGVNPSTYGTDADTDWLYVRGFQADQSGMFLDNLPLYQTGFGTFLVDPFLLERIEVLKGPASVLYGGANVGGIVNYVSKRPNGERFLRTEAGVNNFGNAYVGLDGGDVLADGDLSYRVTGKLSGGSWETDDAQDLRGNVLGSVKWTPSEATAITVYGSYQNVGLDHTSTGFLPYFGTQVDTTDGVRIPRDLNYGEPDADHYDRQQIMIGYELEHEINGDWTVRQNARYATVDLTEEFVYGNGNLIGTELPRIRFGHDTEVGTISIDNQLEGKFDTGLLEHRLLVGLDYKNYHIDQSQAVNNWLTPVPPIDVFNPVYGAALPPLAAPYLDNEISLNQLGVYVQDQIRLDDLILTLNGRYDHVRTDLDNFVNGTSTGREEGNFTGRVGLGYEFDNGLTPYVSYATSFNPTVSTDVDGNLLRSETGEQWEAGVKYAPDFFDGLITASVFNIERANVSGPDPLFPGTQAAIGTVNLWGAELEAAANVGDFTVKGALTLLEAEVLESAGSAFDPVPAGNSPVQIPELTASLSVEYTIPEGALEGVAVGAGMRYLGESWADNANTTRVHDVALFDASLRYKKDDWGVALTVSNIFDTSYVSSCQSLTSCGYGAGRTATLSVHKSW
ncbi:TonB-dependent siderophore receptor [Devosia naphthalenivorans]|uniref:TonB-dependent siderophore receptor n=1 Tax=Devosia naphthalenivorans TaxID=2082392 RepID=UPI0013B058B9|nr:TonB-dependent siderophore receptor [Devosia naphthalenivorans]